MAEETQEQPVTQEHQLIHPSQYDPNATPEAPKETPTETVEKTEPATEAPTEPVKEEIKEPEAEKPEETPSSPKWEEEKVKLEKRLQDNANWTNRVNQENAYLKQMMAQQQKHIEKISKQIEGTWTEADEQAFAQPPVDPTRIAEDASFKGRLDASMLAAEDRYGKEFVDSVVRAPEGAFVEFINNPVIRAAITADKSPVVKAVEMFKWVQMQEKYGATPESFVAGVEKELETKIRAKVEKELKSALKQKDNLPKGIGDISTDNLPNPTTAWGPEQQLHHLRATRAGSESN